MQSDSIDNLELSTRASNALHRAKIFTVEELLTYDREKLQELRNVGAKTVDEVLEKIAQIKADKDAPLKSGVVIQSASDVLLEDLSDLSPRSFNVLRIAGYKTLDQVIGLNRDTLMGIPMMTEECAENIEDVCKTFISRNQEAISLDIDIDDNDYKLEQIMKLLRDSKRSDLIIKYCEQYDVQLDGLLSARPSNGLKRLGCMTMSQLIQLPDASIERISHLGNKSIEEIKNCRKAYLLKHADMLLAVVDGNVEVLYSDEKIQMILLNMYAEKGKEFSGFHYEEMLTAVQAHFHVKEDRLKRVIGSMLANRELEYVDYRCYRVYISFWDYAEASHSLSDRDKELLRYRRSGLTLEEMGEKYNVTRERVRQIVKKASEKLVRQYPTDTGIHCFDEDYYRHIYSTYSIEKRDAEQWNIIPDAAWKYLELIGAKKGNTELEEAVNDKRIDTGLRLKILNYSYRNCLQMDGRRVQKTRADLELYIAEKFCQDTVTFEDFSRIYNQFLEDEEVPYDENIYYTDEVLRTRENHLSESRYILWKQSRQLRYYDIDARDYTELWDTLNLSAFENTEISTLKFMEDYPEILEKYDIRDQYELHNLLKKTVAEGSFHDIHFKRMPTILFGTFDRRQAFYELMEANAPISIDDFVELVHQEYGYDKKMLQIGGILSLIGQYYHQGIFSVEEKIMPPQNAAVLLEALSGDFYYLHELKDIYKKRIPDADVDEINPYNLKGMGFIVLSRYAVRNYSSLEAYCEHLLTSEDLVDITPFRRRMTYVQIFSQKYSELKRERMILEYEPNKLINIRKLNASGIGKEELDAFCRQVAEFVKPNTYFSIQSIKQEGFQAELFDLGFDDWFYSSLLSTDNRFSYSNMYKNIILFHGTEEVTRKQFMQWLIDQYGEIDIIDLQDIMMKQFGCGDVSKDDIVYLLADTEVYYDKILNKFYANEDLYYRELDADGDF